jgi:hypothetical protein
MLLDKCVICVSRASSWPLLQFFWSDRYRPNLSFSTIFYLYIKYISTTGKLTPIVLHLDTFLFYFLSTIKYFVLNITPFFPLSVSCHLMALPTSWWWREYEAVVPFLHSLRIGWGSLLRIVRPWKMNMSYILASTLVRILYSCVFSDSGNDTFHF